MTGARLDVEIVQRGLLTTRSAARRAIIEGHVAVGGATVTKPAQRVRPDAEISVDNDARTWVSRGGTKLSFALDRFQVEVDDRTAIDVGASTGGFTEVLLAAGARHVVALDVGHDQLHESLLVNPRVDSRERLNVRDADPGELGGPFGVVVADLSFISLTVVAASLADLGRSTSDWIVLAKPQFEVGRGNLDKTGVVTDPKLRGAAVVDVGRAFLQSGLSTVGCVASPISGGSGNREALLWMRKDGAAMSDMDLYKVLHDE